MTIEFSCPKCDETMTAERDSVGMSRPCDKCETPLTVPAPHYSGAATCSKLLYLLGCLSLIVGAFFLFVGVGDSFLRGGMDAGNQDRLFLGLSCVFGSFFSFAFGSALKCLGHIAENTAYLQAQSPKK